MSVKYDSSVGSRIFHRKNKINVEREFHKNQRRNVLMKFKKIMQLCNVDVFNEHSIHILLILCANSVMRKEMLLEFLEQHSVQMNELDSLKGLEDFNSLQIRNNERKNRDTFPEYYDTGVNENESRSESSNKRVVKLKTLKDSFCWDYVDNWNDIISEQFNTINDWIILLEYFYESITNNKIDDFGQPIDVNLKSHFLTCAHKNSLLFTSVIPLIAISINTISPIQILQRLVVKYLPNAADAETRSLKLLSQFHSRLVDPVKDYKDYLQILNCCTITNQFSMHMLFFLQEEFKEIDNLKPLKTSRLQLRYKNPVDKCNEYSNASYSFQTWCTQQKFSTISSRQMQLILYFIKCQKVPISTSCYVPYYSDTISERFRISAEIENIDIDAVWECINTCRQYQNNISCLIDFRTNCLVGLTKNQKGSLSLVDIFKLYIISYQHESIYIDLWKRIIPQMNHTTRVNLSHFKSQHEFESSAVIENFLANTNNMPYKRFETVLYEDAADL